MKDKVVLITGGTSGIGKACAFAFGKAGAKVAVSGRNQQNLDETSKELSAAGIDNLAINADVSIEADCQRMVQETVNRFGNLDVLINNAGISMRALFQDLDLDKGVDATRMMVGAGGHWALGPNLDLIAKSGAGLFRGRINAERTKIRGQYIVGARRFGTVLRRRSE